MRGGAGAAMRGGGGAAIRGGGAAIRGGGGVNRLDSCLGGGGGGGAARLASGLEGGGGDGGGVTGLMTPGFASVVVVGREAPFLSCRAFSCSCRAGFVVACVPVGLPGVVEVAFSSLRLVLLPVSAGDVDSFVPAAAPPEPVPAAPEGDVVVPSFEVFGLTPPGPAVPDAPPLLASVPFPVGGRFVGRA